ncbi:hypothetical protein AVEN_172451-1 [Araneus ventricosus]|uniref:Uncharacterized protein n=1 Tax=Araneus ventricosus TaxID=182803 RepID=A0A4Y2DXW4_ARAVE|nr:hypothetical protein AVEN_172451-1 [Araneus ventricosus]
MDSKTQVNKTSVTGRTGCKQPGKKKAKKRKSSRLNVFIYFAGGKSSNCHKLVHNYDEPGTTNISSMVVRVKVRIRYKYSVIKKTRMYKLTEWEMLVNNILSVTTVPAINVSSAREVHTNNVLFNTCK